MTRRPSDDLFEDTRMSFGEHLEELRKTLVRCLIGVALGCIVGFLVAENVVNFLQSPLKNAINEYKTDAALEKYTGRLGFFPPEIETRMQRDGMAPQTVHIDPGQLVQSLRGFLKPEALAEIDLTPYRFPAGAVPADKVSELAGLLTGADSGADADRARRIQALRDLLTDRERSDLAALRENPGAENRDGRIVDILNRLIEDPALHRDAAFLPQMTEPEWSFVHLLSPPGDNQLERMKQVVDARPEDADLSRRLNRVLVARVFPDQIAAPVIDLVPLEIWQRFDEGTQALSPHEVFMVWIKAAIITGLVLAGPWIFFQLWMFVAVGLYPHEQRYVYYYLPISILLFLMGVCLAFFFVFEPVLQFLFSFNASMGIAPQLRIGEWLSFVMFLPLGFGIAFQLPLVMLFAHRVGLASLEMYTSNWRIAVMIISVLSMLLTPADPISMIMLGGPLTLLYFFGIGLCRWMPSNRNPFAEDAIAPVS